MRRSGRSYGAPRYQGRTTMKFGRAGRRRRSFWRSYVVTPILILLGLGAAGFVAAVVVNLVAMPSPARPVLSAQVRQKAPNAPAGSRAGAGAATGAAGKAPQGGPGGKASPGVKGGNSRSVKVSGTSAEGAGVAVHHHTTTSRGGGFHHGRGKSHTANTTAPAKHGGAVSLAHAGGGVDAYAAKSGPIVATLHVAWPTWVRVLSDGKLTFLREEGTGYTATYRGVRSLDVYLGYPQGSSLSVNGTQLGPFPGRSPMWVDIGTRKGG